MSFWSWLGDWAKTVSVRARYLFGVWCLGLIVLLLPKGAADFFGITAMREVARPYVGTLTLAALVFWSIALLPWFQARKRVRLFRQAALEHLTSLSEDERMLLACCVFQGRDTLLLPAAEPAALALRSKGLFTLRPGPTNILACPFTIPGFVWEALQAHPELVVRDDDHGNPAVVRRFQEIERRARQGSFLDL